jgi:hypothetical protein
MNFFRGARLALLLGSASLPGGCYEGGFVGDECRSGLQACAGECVDLLTDSRNCGACGVECPGGRACFRGLYCEGFGPGAAGAGGDGGDGGSAAVGEAGAETAGAAGSGKECFEPFNTAAHCGECDKRCEAPARLCDCTGDECRCVSECETPLLQCGSSCADPNTDSSHCGSCFVECASGLCQAGVCAGSLPGHVVLMCTSLREARQSHPQTVLFGNAAFLPSSRPARVLTYAEYADPTAEERVAQVLDWAAAARGRQYVTTVAGNQSDLPGLLTIRDYDVLIVLDQPNAPAGELASMGAAWQPSIERFVASGGTVIVLGGTEGVAEMPAFITSAGLLGVEDATVLPSTVSLYVRAPSDGVGVNALSPFQPVGETCTYRMSQSPDPSTVYVVTDAPPGAELGGPVVVHRVSTL